MNSPEDRKKHIDKIIEQHKAEITARQKRYEEAKDSPLILLYSVLMTIGVIALFVIIRWLASN